MWETSVCETVSVTTATPTCHGLITVCETVAVTTVTPTCHGLITV